MAESRNKYSKEFKEDAVRLLNAGHKSAREIERDLGIGSGCIYRWRKELEQAESDGVLAFPGNGNVFVLTQAVSRVGQASSNCVMEPYLGDGRHSSSAGNHVLRGVQMRPPWLLT